MKLTPTVTATMLLRNRAGFEGQISFLKSGSLSSTMAAITVTSVSTINCVIATSGAPKVRKISAVATPTTPSAQIPSRRDLERMITTDAAATRAASDQSRNVASANRTGPGTTFLIQRVTARLSPSVANTISK